MKINVRYEALKNEILKKEQNVFIVTLQDDLCNVRTSAFIMKENEFTPENVSQMFNSTLNALFQYPNLENNE